MTNQPHKFSLSQKKVAGIKKAKTQIEVAFLITLAIAVLLGATVGTSNNFFQLSAAALFILALNWVMASANSNTS